MKSIVFFGTLMSKNLLEIILDRDLNNLNFHKGFIYNCKLFKVNNENFPYLEITNKETDIVRCIYIDNLSSLDFRKITFYESIEYKIKEIEIIVESKKINSSYFSLITNNKSKNEWIFQEWKINFEKNACMAAKKWMVLFKDYENKPAEAEIYWPQILEASK